MFDNDNDNSFIMRYLCSHYMEIYHKYTQIMHHLQLQGIAWKRTVAIEKYIYAFTEVTEVNLFAFAYRLFSLQSTGQVFSTFSQLSIH